LAVTYTFHIPLVTIFTKNKTSNFFSKQFAIVNHNHNTLETQLLTLSNKNSEYRHPTQGKTQRKENDYLTQMHTESKQMPTHTGMLTYESNIQTNSIAVKCSEDEENTQMIKCLCDNGWCTWTPHAFHPCVRKHALNLMIKSDLKHS
jgi:hypothetical protein